MRKISVRIFMCLGLALALVAPSSLAQAAPKVVLKVRALGDPQTLDWNRATTWMDGILIYNLMEGLVGVDSRSKPVANLAQRWTTSPDKRTYTFHLRKGVKWSDGAALKASQFVDSWKRLLEPATAARYASVLFDIEGALAYNKGELKDFNQVGVKALDDLTLQVKLRQPISFWYWIVTSYTTYPIRKDLVEKHPNSWDKAGTMVSLGSYVLATHEPGRSITLEKNPHYYGKRGNIDQILFALVSDDTTALKLYDVGQIDFLPKISPLDKKRLKNRPDFESWPELRTVHLAFNVAQNPVSNEHLRRAIGHAIDRSKVDKLFDGGYQPASTFVPHGLMGHTPKGGLGFDLEKAKAEVKLSGLDATKLPPLDLLTVAFDDHVILAQFIQDELKRNLGLSVRIHILEPKRYYSPLLNHNDYAMQLNLWGADFPDPDNFLSVFLSSSTLSRYRWQNRKYDDLVIGARSLGDNERKKSYAQAHKVLQEEDVVTVPLYYGRISGLVRKGVKGFVAGPMSWWYFKELSIK